jgi:sulfite exporter TauE/SafE
LLLPLFLGLFTGLTLCPPFLLAIVNAAESGSILGSLLFFLLFFLGTAIYFIPLPFIGAFRRLRILQTVGKFAAGVMGVYYFYLGLIMFYGGIELL